ncbi:MAG: hypothetical protein U0L69_07905 [Eggerthellaceae bacterium]|nr:hypothetical protein [Eggerthellaceae bacterium]
MSREIEIRDRIARLDPAAFQNLAQELLSQYFRYDKPVHRGSAARSAATAPGTPDTIWLLPHNKFAYLECGHYPERAEAKKKIEADIEKCLETERKELDSGQLVKIIIAYSCRRLDSSDLSYLRGIDGRVELVGTDEMASLLARRYPSLAREHLGIEVGTGQIMSPDEFESAVEKNSFASTLKDDLLGRDKEVSELLAALEENQFVLVYGRPGCGKTRLCVEALRRFAYGSSAHPLVIQSNKLPIWNDLANDVPKEAPSIIMLDDANELSGLEGFADFVSNRGNIKVLMTVRNYAFEHVKISISKFCRPYLYEVNPLDEETALNVVENGFGIAKGRASADIVRLSRGNMRLACAAAEVAKERGVEVFSTMPSLIEACYGEKASLLGGNAKMAATIVSVLDSHSVEGNKDLDKLLAKVGISHDCYVDACATLCHDELVDACQGMVAVAPGEQVLRDYLLYRAFIAEKSLSLSDVDELECGNARCPSIVAILVNNFYSEELISSLKSQLDDIWALANEEKRWGMVGEYHFLLGEKGLGHILGAIEGCEPGNYDYLTCRFDKSSGSYLPESRILVSLTPFFHAPQFDEPEELFFMALGKNILPPREAKEALTTAMCFNEDSYSDEFRYEKEVIERLTSDFRKTKENRYGVLLAYYAEALLAATYDGPTRMEGNKVTFIHGNHVYTEAMVGLRKRAIACLKELRGCSELSRLCDTVITGVRGIGGDDGAGRLWKETLEELYKGYVSRIEAIEICSLPGFVQLEKEFISQGVIAEEGLPFLDASPEERIAAQIFSEDSCGHDISEELTEVVQAASSAEVVKAISIVCSAGRQSSTYIPYPILRDVMILGADALTECADLIILSGVPAYAVPDDLLIRWIDLLGINRVRGLALKREENEILEWLSWIDEVRFKEFGVTPELARDIEEGADEYGETVSYEAAMEIDSATPGFFAKYAAGVLQKLERGSHAFRRLLPSNINNAEQRAFASKPEMLCLAEEILLNLVSGRSSYWDEDLLRFIISNDSQFPERAMPVLMEFDATYAMGHLGEAAWREENGEAATDGAWKGIEGVETSLQHMLKPFALKHFLNYAIEHCGDAVVTWLVSRSMRDGKLVDYLPDVAMELPKNLKVKYIVLLCQEGLSSEELKKVPVIMSSFGASWSGSEIPLLQGKINFIEEVIENLPGVALIRHRMVLEDAIASVKRRIEYAEVDEFLRPF